VYSLQNTMIDVLVESAVTLNLRNNYNNSQLKSCGLFCFTRFRVIQYLFLEVLHLF
jgi:hypothetical protein